MNHKTLDRALKNRGFGGLEDPQIIHQLAFCVRDHEHFRTLLTACLPDKRTVMFETMRPHLNFEAKPLDVYLAESAEMAAHRESDQSPLDVMASDAIRRNQQESKVKGSLLITCIACTKEAVFPAVSRHEAAKDAAKAGWKLVDKKEFCPDCAPRISLQ